VARPIFTPRPDALARVPLRPVQGDDNESADLLLMEAVTVASEPAGNAAGRSLPGSLTWRAYATRSRTRATPHGVFAGVAAASFSREPELRMRTSHRTLTTPDPRWLAILARSIIESPDGLLKARLTTSNLIVTRGGRYEVERPMDAGSVRPATISVRSTDVSAFILRACRDGLPAGQVISEMAQRWPQAPPASGPRLVRELIDGGFLLHDLLPGDPRRDPLGHLLDRIPAGSPHALALGRLRARLAEVDRHRPGDPGRLEALTAATVIAREIVPVDPVLRVDTAVDATVILPATIARKAAEAAGVLWRIGRGADPLADYHQRFLTRYGTAQAVPILDVLDPVIGLGPLDDTLTAVGAGPPDPAVETVLARLLADAIAGGTSEVVLDEAAVDRLASRSPMPPPRSAEIYVQILAADGSERAAGGIFQIAVSGGSQDALSSTGRFAALLNEHRETPASGDGALVAEVVARPRTVAVATVAAEAGFAAHRIAVGVPPRPGDLGLADLVVFSDGGRLLLWSLEHGRRVLPVLYSRVSPQLLPPVARFLVAAGHTGERPWHCWSWHGITAPFTPAVRYRGTWLAPARWTLPPHLIQAAQESGGWDEALASWRAQAQPPPPGTVVTDDADRRLPLDLQRDDDRALLRRYVRRGLTAVTAPYGDAPSSAAVLPGTDGGHLLELVVDLDRASREALPVQAAPSALRPESGLHLPGGPWLSLAIQTPAACHEQVLRSLAMNADRLRCGCDRWFWIRYLDQRHGEHLRVRFHADPAIVNGTVLPLVSAWASGLHQERLIAGFCVEPYVRETSRFGGPGAITAAERFFAADSALALDALSAIKGEDARMIVAADCASAIANRIGGGAVLGGRLGRRAHHRVNTLRPRVRSAKLTRPDEWAAALDSYAAAIPARSRLRVASDLIHLHCNRLVPGCEDMVRALAADLIARVTRFREESR
jgi:lantibiotic biosynthesis protein